MLVAELPQDAVADAGPNSSACATASADVLIRAVAVVNETGKLDQAQKARIEQLTNDVKTAQAAFDKAVDAVVNAGDKVTPAQLAAMEAARRDLERKTRALQNAVDGLPPTALLLDLTAALNVAVDLRNTACAGPPPTPTPTPTVTVTPPPPSTTTAPPAPRIERPAPQVIRVPSGPAETGGR
jgi:hypothetical protein